MFESSTTSPTRPAARHRSLVDVHAEATSEKAALAAGSTGASPQWSGRTRTCRRPTPRSSRRGRFITDAEHDRHDSVIGVEAELADSTYADGSARAVRDRSGRPHRRRRRHLRRRDGKSLRDRGSPRRRLLIRRRLRSRSHRNTNGATQGDRGRPVGQRELERNEHRRGECRPALALRRGTNATTTASKTAAPRRPAAGSRGRGCHAWYWPQPRSRTGNPRRLVLDRPLPERAHGAPERRLQGEDREGEHRRDAEAGEEPGGAAKLERRVRRPERGHEERRELGPAGQSHSGAARPAGGRQPEADEEKRGHDHVVRIRVQRVRGERIGRPREREQDGESRPAEAEADRTRDDDGEQVEGDGRRARRERVPSPLHPKIAVAGYAS